MPDITAAMDEHAATQVIGAAQASLGTLTNNGSSTFGPFTASFGASGTFSGAVVHLYPPNVVQIAGCSLNYTVAFNLSFDLSNIIPNLYIPGWSWSFTIKLGKFWQKTITISIPPWSYNWPTVTIPVSFSDTVQFAANYKLVTQYIPPRWHVDAVILAVPQLQTTPAASALLILIGAATAPALIGIPFIGPFLAGAVLGITNTVGIAGAANFLGVMITPLVAGTRFPIYDQPEPFPLLPATGPIDPTVFIHINSINAAVVHSGEPELVLSINVSP
jgi:hypothetical protein